VSSCVVRREGGGRREGGIEHYAQPHAYT
jgi:hypothetical protein